MGALPEEGQQGRQREPQQARLPVACADTSSAHAWIGTWQHARKCAMLQNIICQHKQCAT